MKLYIALIIAVLTLSTVVEARGHGSHKGGSHKGGSHKGGHRSGRSTK